MMINLILLNLDLIILFISKINKNKIFTILKKLSLIINYKVNEVY